MGGEERIATTRENPLPERCDVLICGAGLAGLTLALQLRREQPELSIVLVDRLRRPFPEGAFKVGESFTEAGSFYLDSQAPGYFADKHLYKMGFRFFLNGPEEEIERRPELGLVRFPIVTSYNVDRGRAEEDLRQFAVDAGVTLIEGARVADVDLHADEDHRVRLEAIETGESSSIGARWFIDASGRRRLLQRKLGLSKDAGEPCGAAWFRLPGRIDVSDLAGPGSDAWRERVPDNNRFWSANHLVGPGYWLWLIPLPCDMTSVGIVAHEDYHPFDSYNTFDRAKQWLRDHEPAFARYIEGIKPVDFGAMRNYSYSARQVFSKDRWACVGEAAVFTDPLYAQGGDLIAYANNVVADLLNHDRAGTLTAAIERHYNQTFLATCESLMINVQNTYFVFQSAVVAVTKALWDFVAGWSFFAPMVFNPSLNTPEQAEIRKARARYFFLTKRMQELFRSWASRPPGTLGFEFINFIGVSLLQEARDRNLHPGKTAEELIDDHAHAMRRAEELAQVLFRLAIEDQMPERLAEIESAGWLNAWAVSLDPSRWEQDGLFAPTSEPRDLQPLTTELQALFSRRVPSRV